MNETIASSTATMAKRSQNSFLGLWVLRVAWIILGLLWDRKISKTTHIWKFFPLYERKSLFYFTFLLLPVLELL